MVYAQDLKSCEVNSLVWVRVPPPAQYGSIGNRKFAGMVKHTTGSTTFYTYGVSPQVLLLSGMHGDEAESGSLLENWLKSTRITLPPFLYIPQASPSAVRAGTRKNAYGHDLNRQFLDKATDPEVLEIMKIVQPYTFELCIDVHEDPDRLKSFYLYDSDRMNELDVSNYRETVQKTKGTLYTGIDDIDDEHLQRHVERGYVSFRPADVEVTSGFASIWFIKIGLVKRAFTTEIPGKAAVEVKESLINGVLPFLFTTFGVK